MYLVPRPDLGDVSQGKLVSLTNYYEMFNGILLDFLALSEFLVENIFGLVSQTH